MVQVFTGLLLIRLIKRERQQLVCFNVALTFDIAEQPADHLDYFGQRTPVTNDDFAISPSPIPALFEHPKGHHDIDLGGIASLVGPVDCGYLLIAIRFVNQIDNLNPLLAPLDPHDWLVCVSKDRHVRSSDGFQHRTDILPFCSE